jgi:hypothetical protein
VQGQFETDKVYGYRPIQMSHWTACSLGILTVWD